MRLGINFNNIKNVCFNSRTREGATVVFIEAVKTGLVSIHAPVKVRPDELAGMPYTQEVSIHAPVKVRRM